MPHLWIAEVAQNYWLRVGEMVWQNRDPADRIIATTAIGLGMPVLTGDGKFHRKDSPVEAVW